MRTRPLLIASATLLLLLVATYVTYSVQTGGAFAAAEGELGDRASLLAQSLDRLLQSRMVETFTLAALPSMRGFAASDEATRPQRLAIARVELQSAVDADPNIRAGMIVDPAGYVSLATDDSIGQNYGDRIFVRQALQGQLYASPPAQDSGEISQYYTAPILNNAGDVAGVLVLRIAVQEMWGLVNTQTDVQVIDENGVLIADHSASPQLFVSLMPISDTEKTRLLDEKHYGTRVVQIFAINAPVLAQAVRADNEKPFVYRDAKGRALIGVIRRLKVNGWSVVAFTSQDSVLQNARNAFLTSLAFGLFVLFATAGFFVARSIWGTRS
ncbi:MAG: cache domain-containing protein [Chloroflexi bacterium]|nr:cache domain-containing protein [Chloroflexota bacterium]